MIPKARCISRASFESDRTSAGAETLSAVYKGVATTKISSTPIALRAPYVLPVVALLFICVGPCHAPGAPEEGPAPQAVQIDVGTVLNVRVITVVKDGALVPMRDDIDGAGGLATKAASDLMGNKNAYPLPDDATFAATDRHPRVVLNYANENPTQNQAHRSQGEDTFDFLVPEQKYAHLHLFPTSGWGASKIVVKLVYSDHSVERRDLEVPDWFWELKPDDSYRSYLAVNPGKWSKGNKMIEDNHHFIFNLDVTPSPGKTLSKLYVHEEAPGLTVFYGATGVPAR